MTHQFCHRKGISFSGALSVLRRILQQQQLEACPLQALARKLPPWCVRLLEGALLGGFCKCKRISFHLVLSSSSFSHSHLPICFVAPPTPCSGYFFAPNKPILMLSKLPVSQMTSINSANQMLAALKATQQLSLARLAGTKHHANRGQHRTKS